MSVIINPNLNNYYIVIGGDAAPVSLKSIKFLNPYDFSLKVGEIKDLELVIDPPEAINYIDINDIKWVSSNESVLTVDSTGIVTAKSEGTAKIAAKYRRHIASVTCKVINPIKFADPKTKKLCLKLWDKNGDGEISYSEAEKVTFIPQIFANSKITSFNELQYFKNVKNISPSAFEGCSYLSSITLPKNIETIGKHAFYDCDSLTQIVLPASLNNIGFESFANCENLTYVVSNSKTPPIGSHMFGDDDPKLYSIKVPSNSRDIYCSHPSWEEYRSYINNVGFDYTFDFYLG